MIWLSHVQKRCDYYFDWKLFFFIRKLVDAHTIRYLYMDWILEPLECIGTTKIGWFSKWFKLKQFRHFQRSFHSRKLLSKNSCNWFFYILLSITIHPIQCVCSLWWVWLVSFIFVNCMVSWCVCAQYQS